MNFVTHLGFTTALLAMDHLIGTGGPREIYMATITIVGGVFLDTDKVFEMIDVRLRARKFQLPDITARWRILHSILAFPFGLILIWLVDSWLPFWAVMVHSALDGFVPGLEYRGKWYSSHSPLKWLALPFSKKWWSIVTIGWPVVYPPKLNWVYTKLMPIIGSILFIGAILLPAIL